ncbi:Outer membrane cobalamin receptor protein, SusC/RagA family [Bacteroidales bacterium Barb6]|nr:Outer membrane cobalamin receptor protein, SusC/RagA family [Bacteroidales bacterium Barb6]
MREIYGGVQAAKGLLGKVIVFVIVMVGLLVGRTAAAQSERAISVAGYVAVRGTVVSGVDGEVLAGANVVAVSTWSGTVTGIDGGFELTVLKDGEFEVSYIGFLRQRVKVVEGQEVYRVILEEDNRVDEIVTVGYGVQKKNLVTAAIGRVTARDLTATPTRIEDVLKGRITGVQITQNSGQPGVGSIVRMRGTGTINNSDPLFVVDGMPVDGSIDYLDPRDIESVEVLKDAASGAIYGARAANGVILVTTKKGTAGRTNVSYQFSYGLQNPWRKRALLNGREYEEIMNEACYNAGKEPLFNYFSSAGEGTDWQDMLFNRDAAITNHSASISGGSDKGSYYLSFGVLDQEGIVAQGKSDYRRNNFRINSTYNLFENDRSFFKSVKAGVNAGYTKTDRHGIIENSEFNGALSAAAMYPPNVSVYANQWEEADLAEKYGDMPVRDGNGRMYKVISGGEFVNPLALVAVRNQRAETQRIVGTVWGEADVAKGLVFRSSYATDLTFGEETISSPAYYLSENHLDETSHSEKDMDRRTVWSFENTLRYGVSSGRSNFNFLLGTTTLRDHFTDISEYSMGSVFWRANYDYGERLLAEFVLRGDGSSNFPPDRKRAYFPSVSLGWNIINAGGFSTESFANQLKLRTSWGRNGNDKLYPGIAVGRLTNRSIRWDESEQFDAGVDMRFGGLSFTADIFHESTKGMLMKLPVPDFAGNEAAGGNVGSMTNKGMEMEIAYMKETADFGFRTGMNVSHTKNVVEDVGVSAGYIDYATFGTIGVIQRHTTGLPVAHFFGREAIGVFQNENQIRNYQNKDGQVLQPGAKPGDVIFRDVNGDGNIDDEDKTYLGKPVPDWTLGANLALRYKAFDFSMFWQGAFGGQIFDASRRFDLITANYSSYILDRWHGEGTSYYYPRVVYARQEDNQNSRVSSLDVYNGDYVRLKTFQAGVTLPPAFTRKFLVQNFRLYILAENLFTLTGYHGGDPETGAGMGVDRGIYPQARTVSVGVSLLF